MEEAKAERLPPRLVITPGLRKFLDYPKFAGATRMLILETSYFFDKSWERAGRSLGWEVATVPSVMIGSLGREHIQSLFITLGEFRPHFVITSNYAGMDVASLFERFFEDARIPYVSWFTDTPRMILYGRQIYASPYTVVATWERSYTKHFERLGFRHVHFMPHAADPELFSGTPYPQPSRPLGFVGSSMISQAEEAWEKLEPMRELVSALRRALDAGMVTRERFAEGVESILDPELLANVSARDRRHIELCLNYEATRRQRADLAKRLAPHGLEVRGDGRWLEVIENVAGEVGYFSDLAGYYRDTAINVNTTSIQMQTAVNQRVFDCPAAGGFLISDAQEDLGTFFEPDVDMATYTSLDELEDKIVYFRDRPQERIAMIQRAQRRIASGHTHAHRLLALEAFLKERFA